MIADDLGRIVDALAGRRVLVVGDMVLDEYLVGRAVRLSREAPVPVLEHTHSFTLLGGACNPAHNVAALGSRAIMAGVVGQDPAGRRLLDALQAAGIDPSGVVLDETRPTTTKTRLVAESVLRTPQHLARIDTIARRPLDSQVEIALLERLEAYAPDCDAILVSHYRSGVATPALADRVRQLARHYGLLTVADAQADLSRFAGFDLVKCNRAEAEAELDQILASPADFERALARLMPQMGVERLVITRGADGMSALQRGHVVAHSAAVPVGEVYDVVGAGDTVVAVLALALAARLSLDTAMNLANIAAGLVVRRLGNAVVRPAELIEALGKAGQTTWQGDRVTG
jgi:rfaE bifunctional protein kinase chain/domain